MYWLFFLPLLVTASVAVTSDKLQTVFEWKYFDYEWPSPEVKDSYVKNKNYHYQTMFPVDVDRAPDGRIFVTTVGFGVPSSVNIVSDKNGPSGPLLRPYPNWDFHKKGTCNSIQTAYRLIIDKCNRLWVLDSGTENIVPVCPAKLWVFDLTTDKLIEALPIPNEFARNPKNGKTLLITPAVDYDDFDKNCAYPKVFMADAVGLGMVLYDGGTKKFGRIQDKCFEPELNHSNFIIDNTTFHLEDGIFGLAVSPSVGLNREKYLMFRPLASRTLHVSNPGLALAVIQGKPFNYLSYNDIFSNQVSVFTFSADGTFFYALTTETAIGCWDTKRFLSPNSVDVVIQDSGRLQFAGGIKVTRDSLGREKLFILTSSLQRVWTQTMKFDEINYRITTADVKEVIVNTKCNPFYIPE